MFSGLRLSFTGISISYLVFSAWDDSLFHSRILLGSLDSEFPVGVPKIFPQFGFSSVIPFQPHALYCFLHFIRLFVSSKYFINVFSHNLFKVLEKNCNTYFEVLDSRFSYIAFFRSTVVGMLHSTGGTFPGCYCVFMLESTCMPEFGMGVIIGVNIWSVFVWWILHSLVSIGLSKS